MAGMDAEFGRWLTTLGVGGVLAAFMFYFYRKDVKSYTELWKAQTEILITVVRENTKSNEHLIVLVDALHRRLDNNHIGVIPRGEAE